MAGISTKVLKNRIRSMTSTRQITRAMEMAAASKLRRAQERIGTSRPYFQILSTTMQDLLSANRDLSSPYLRQRSGNRVLYLVIAGDRGLAGGYNSRILKLVQSKLAGVDAAVLPMGKMSVEFFRSQGVRILSEQYAGAAEVGIGDCFSMAKQVCLAFLNSEYDRIYVAYTDFSSVLSQVPVIRQLLPLLSEGTEPQNQSSQDITWEPGSQESLAAIVPEYLGGILYGAICESRASEAAARRSAMDTATRNADDMIAALRLKHNRVRQAAITQEITEIIAGS